MSAQILNLVAKKALGNVAKKNINSKDPFYEEVPVYRHGRVTNETKKVKKGIPEGLSKNDAKILKQVRKQAFYLDMCLFNCCGIRVGWSSVIGILPVLGDFLDMFMAYMLVQKCGLVDGGLPPAIQYRMLFNVAVDFGVGLIPFIGDIADALFRANTRNAWILEEYLKEKLDAEKVDLRNQEPKEGAGTVPNVDNVRPQGSTAGPRVLPGSYEQVRPM